MKFINGTRVAITGAMRLTALTLWTIGFTCLGTLPAAQALSPEDLKIFGQVRIRGEWINPLHANTAVNGGKIGQRTRLGFSGPVSDEISFLVEAQDSRLWGEATAVDQDAASLDLSRAYFEWSDLLDGRLSLRMGRDEVPNLGDQRFMSSLDWSHQARHWEALTALFSQGRLESRAFVADSRQSLRAKARGEDVLAFSGFYNRLKIAEAKELDLYILARHLSGHQMDATAGLRAKKTRGRAEATLELAYQFNDEAGPSFRAWAGTLKTELKGEGPRKPALLLEYAQASGDSNLADGKARTFDPLLSFGHFYHGHLDQVGLRNVRTYKAGFRGLAFHEVNLHVDGHMFRLVDAQDAWYGAGGGAVRWDPTGAASKELGMEVDVYLKGKLNAGLGLWTGYSRFQPGDFARDTGAAPPVDWAFLQLAASF